MPTPFEIIKKEDHGIWKYDANRSDDFGIDIWEKREFLWWRKVKRNAEFLMMFILQVSEKFF